MRRNIPAVFSILLFGILILCSACTGPGNAVPKQGTGLVQVTVPSGTSVLSFDTALLKFEQDTASLFNRSPEDSEKIYYILAQDVDERGYATSWFFGVRNISGSRLLIYDKNGRTEMPMSDSSLPVEEIVPDRIVPPGKLFSENKAVIVKGPVPSAPEMRELELKEGNYTLTITSGPVVRVLKFNAASGALIG